MLLEHTCFLLRHDMGRPRRHDGGAALGDSAYHISY